MIFILDSEIVEKVSELVNNVVHDIEVDDMKEKYDSLASFAKTTFLKRLNRLKIDDSEHFHSNNRQLFEASKNHSKRNLDRSHSRMLKSRVLKNLVRTLGVIQLEADKQSKYLNYNESENNNFTERIEYIVLGLKAKENSFVKLAKKALINTFEATSIKKLFSALKNYDNQIAQNYLEKFKNNYSKELKDELNHLLNN